MYKAYNFLFWKRIKMDVDTAFRMPLHISVLKRKQFQFSLLEGEQSIHTSTQSIYTYIKMVRCWRSMKMHFTFHIFLPAPSFSSKNNLFLVSFLFSTKKNLIRSYITKRKYLLTFLLLLLLLCRSIEQLFEGLACVHHQLLLCHHTHSYSIFMVDNREKGRKKTFFFGNLMMYGPGGHHILMYVYV